MGATLCQVAANQFGVDHVDGRPQGSRNGLTHLIFLFAAIMRDGDGRIGEAVVDSAGHGVSRLGLEGLWVWVCFGTGGTIKKRNENKCHANANHVNDGEGGIDMTRSSRASVCSRSL